MAGNAMCRTDYFFALTADYQYRHKIRKVAE